MSELDNHCGERGPTLVNEAPIEKGGNGMKQGSTEDRSSIAKSEKEVKWISGGVWQDIPVDGQLTCMFYNSIGQYKIFYDVRPTSVRRLHKVVRRMAGYRQARILPILTPTRCKIGWEFMRIEKG